MGWDHHHHSGDIQNLPHKKWTYELSSLPGQLFNSMQGPHTEEAACNLVGDLKHCLIYVLNMCMYIYIYITNMRVRETNGIVHFICWEIMGTKLKCRCLDLLRPQDLQFLQVKLPCAAA